MDLKRSVALTIFTAALLTFTLKDAIADFYHTTLDRYSNISTVEGKGDLEVLVENADNQFSSNTTYQDLYDPDSTDVPNIRIGIYTEDESQQVDEFKDRNQHILSKYRIIITPIWSKKDYIASLKNDDITIVIGHSHCGKGISFHDGSFFYMGEDSLYIPQEHIVQEDKIIGEYDGLMIVEGNSDDLINAEINIDVLMHFGCRTDVYFRPIIEENFPSLDFISTNYECFIYPIDVLNALGRTLRDGDDVGSMVEELNSRYDFFMNHKIKVEINKYKNKMDEYPAHLVNSSG